MRPIGIGGRLAPEFAATSNYAICPGVGLQVDGRRPGAGHPQRGTSWCDDALAELAHDAYVHSFIRRLRGLQNQRLSGVDVRGLVLRNLRNFLTERQKESDPIGYLVFEQTCKAARQAIEASVVAIINAPPAETDRGDVDSATLLGFGSGLAPVVSEEQLAEIVPSWSDDLFPDLLTARTTAVRDAIGKLARHIADLRDAGIEAFRVGDLVGALKRDLRRRWEATVAEGLGEPGVEDLDSESSLVPTMIGWLNDEIGEDRSYTQVVRCVSQRIANLDNTEVREQLWQVWQFVRSCAVGEVPRLSWTKIAQELGISRKRLPMLYSRLADMVNECREALSRSGSRIPGALRESPAMSNLNGEGERHATGTTRDHDRISG
ncbi:MAG: hypothetical protein GY856_26595 [bacterium]|nr:hypothetical protein [bacterium]